MKKAVLTLLWLSSALHAGAFARGVSPYLPVNLEPEIERQIERVLVLADRPILTRPFAAATVLDALPKACEVDSALCSEVRRFLGRYMYSSGIAHASAEGALTSGADWPVPNRHGLASTNDWQVSAGLYFQPSDYALVSLGGVAYQGETVPTGSVLSLGFSKAQLDIGYREHWLSPMTDSSMLLGTQARTMPSVTLSNYEPLTRLGLRYEAFAARMSQSDRIVHQGGFTSGNPKIVGLHLSIEPVSGWALGINRIMQYGGGARGGQSISDVIDAFFRPSQVDNVGPGLSADQQFGNQAASFTSRFLFPGRVPFAVYFEYGGEDTSRGRNYLLGNSSLSAGLQFPRLWQRFDLTYEVSEWQNSWYVHSVYLDGLTNEGRVLGHWGADARLPGDGVGAQSHMLRAGWDPEFGGQAELRYRTVQNESYTGIDYERAHELTLRYSRPWKGFTVGGEALAGRDVFGEDFRRFGAFIRYANDTGRSRNSFGAAAGSIERDGAELFVVAGAAASEVKIDLSLVTPTTTTDPEVAPHLAVGARRAVSERSDVGVRLELDEVDGELLLGVRALDYRYRFRGPLALGAFLGAARYDLATPAYGVYTGVGAQWRNVVRGWDLGLELRYFSKIARDNLLPGDPPTVDSRNDSFYDVTSASLHLSRRF